MHGRARRTRIPYGVGYGVVAALGRAVRAQCPASPTWGASSWSEPAQDRGNGQHRRDVDGPRFVAGGDAPVLLEPVDVALDHIALAVGTMGDARVWDLLGRSQDDRPDPTLFHVAPDGRAAIALTARNSLRPVARSSSSWPLDRSALHQDRQHWLLMSLALREHESQRQAAALAPEMDLRAVPAAAAAKGLGY